MCYYPTVRDHTTSSNKKREVDIMEFLQGFIQFIMGIVAAIKGLISEIRSVNDEG